MAKIITKYSPKFTKFIKSCADGDVQTVKEMLPQVNPKKNDNHALHVASGYGHLEVVKVLLPVSDPAHLDDHVIAAQNGHLNVVEFLLPYCAQKSNSGALLQAAKNGHVEVVEFLLPFSDPKEMDSAALRFAITEGYHAIVDLLWDVSEPEKALKQMKDRCISPDKWFFIEEKLKAEKSKKHLLENILNNAITPSERKKLKI